jgi:hypothetical protein
MWTIVAYDWQGNLLKGMFATSDQEIAMNYMDKLSLQPEVGNVWATYVARLGAIPQCVIVSGFHASQRQRHNG